MRVGGYWPRRRRRLKANSFSRADSGRRLPKRFLPTRRLDRIRDLPCSFCRVWSFQDRPCNHQVCGPRRNARVSE